AEDGIRDDLVTGVQTCALPICSERISITRPSRASSPPSASSGTMAAIQVFLLASYNACRRLDAVSSGPNTRKLVGLLFITSRRRSEERRVGKGWRCRWVT